MPFNADCSGASDSCGKYSKAETDAVNAHTAAMHRTVEDFMVTDATVANLWPAGNAAWWDHMNRRGVDKRHPCKRPNLLVTILLRSLTSCPLLCAGGAGVTSRSYTPRGRGCKVPTLRPLAEYAISVRVKQR